MSESFYPPLTTVSQPRGEIGRKAMEMLLAFLAGNDDAQSSVELPTFLKIRASTGLALEK
ncbi:substrate-binding domain-containing protein [Phyllobacterium phragmitis]|uniref:substrate-binding domain-containing protein n=1 Tax=Phyllobacterium phragmitis TaxID=2670329 RepID=UPI003159E0E9